MAGADSQKQLLTLSGDFATDKSQSEQMSSDPRKRYSELQKKLDAANANLENAKRSKKKIEDELRCFLEVESSLKDPSIQAEEAKISSGQQELQKALDAANDDLEKAKRSKDQIEHERRSLEVQSSLEDTSIRARELERISLGEHEIVEISESDDLQAKSEFDQSQGRTSLHREEKSKSESDSGEKKVSESDSGKKKAQALDGYEIYYPPSHIYLPENAGEETLIEAKNEVPYIIACELERTISLDSDQSDKSTAYCTDWFAALKGEPSSTAYCTDWFAALVGKEPVVTIHGDKFKELRKSCKLREAAFIKSLKKCTQYTPEGGKSGAYFQITEDKRFIIKEIKNIELKSFIHMAQKYFDYIRRNKCMVKIVGVYQVMKKNIIIMENIFYGRREEILSKYDIKGIIHRHKDKGASTLFEKNFLDDMQFQSFSCNKKTKDDMLKNIRYDTNFLTSCAVMDYSLLVGIDKEKKELVIGIIDYLGPYTWDKKLESWMKILLTFPAFNKPTIIPPKDYQTRFLEFIKEAINKIPDGST